MKFFLRIDNTYLVTASSSGCQVSVSSRESLITAQTHTYTERYFLLQSCLWKWDHWRWLWISKNIFYFWPCVAVAQAHCLNFPSLSLFIYVCVGVCFCRHDVHMDVDACTLMICWQWTLTEQDHLAYSRAECMHKLAWPLFSSLHPSPPCTHTVSQEMT